MTTVAEKPISLAEFEANYLDEERWKYEWVNGRVIREEYITRAELYMIDNILRSYYKTVDYQSGNLIMAEADCYFSIIPSYRRPDAAYLSEDQIKSPEEATEAPALIIEVSSPANTSEQNITKVLEYLEGGVRMVWYIYPGIQQVWIHTGPKEVTICAAGDRCVAHPVIPDFSISIEELFKKKKRTSKK